jgi:hypothetical protein
MLPGGCDIVMAGTSEKGGAMRRLGGQVYDIRVESAQLARRRNAVA